MCAGYSRNKEMKREELQIINDPILIASLLISQFRHIESCASVYTRYIHQSTTNNNTKLKNIFDAIQIGQISQL